MELISRALLCYPYFIGQHADTCIDELSASNDRRRHSLTVCETPTRKKSDSGSVLEDEHTKQQHDRDQRIILSTQMSNMSMSATSATSTSSICSSRSATPVEVCDHLLIFQPYMPQNMISFVPIQLLNLNFHIFSLFCQHNKTRKQITI